MRTGLGERESRRAGKYFENLGVGGSGGKRGIFFLYRVCLLSQLFVDGVFYETPECTHKSKTLQHEDVSNFWLMTRVRIL